MDAERPGPSHKGVTVRSYTVAFKLEVIKYARAHNVSKASRTYKIDRKRVREWTKQEADLKKCEKKAQRKRKEGGGKKISYPAIEIALTAWINRRREAGARVTGKALKQECLRQHRLNGNQQFKASCGWLRSFMRRNKMTFRRATHVGQKQEAVLSDKMQAYLRFVGRLKQRHGYLPSHIGNMDETPIWVDMPGNYTLEAQGSKSINMKSTGHEKSRITVMLAALADGTKLPPMVLFKGVRPLKQIPPGLLIKMTPQAWANE